MNNKISHINKSIQKWETEKKSQGLSEAVEHSTINFDDINQGIYVLAFAASIRA